MDEDKKHLPTPAKRLQAKREGRFAHSRDLTSAAVLLTGLVGIWMLAPGSYDLGINLADSSLSPVDDGQLIEGREALHRFSGLLGNGLILLLPLLTCTWVVAILGTWLQSGFQLFSSRPLVDFARVHPGRGFANWFQGSGFGSAAMGVIKIAVLLSVVAIGLNDAWKEVERVVTTQSQIEPSVRHSDWQTTASSHQYRLSIAAAAVGRHVWLIGLQAASALLLLGIADYGYQWWRHERSLMMTDEELREELKSSGGNPQVLAQRRKVREQISAVTSD